MLSPSGPSTPLEQAILLTVLYSDLFDAPLTDDELYGFLPAPCPHRAPFDAALEALSSRHLHRADGFVCLRGREALLPLRQRRASRAAARWEAAQRFGNWLRRVPFVRMVAVCGSQAVENGDAESDVDFFLITAPGRLWVVQVIVMLLRRCMRRPPICPNYLLTTDTLSVEKRSLYTAREIAQAVPLWGEAVYDRFLDANRWVAARMPQLQRDDRRRFLEPTRRGTMVRTLERLLGGTAGHWLDRLLHRLLLLYYPLRLRRRSAELAQAYDRQRQLVVGGGYASAIEHTFLTRAETLFGAATAATARALWSGSLGAGSEALSAPTADALPPTDLPTPDPRYAGLFAARYGAAGD